MNNNSKPKPKMSKTLNGPMSGVNNSVLQPPKSYAFQSRINKENHSAKLKKRKSVENDLRNSKRLREEIPALQILKSQAGTNARKAARRSVSNALKITRNAAIKRASPKHLSIRKPLSGTGARTNTGRPPLKPRVSPNSSLSSTHSTSNKITLSQSTSRASTDGKKTKRKAWDVKGQLDDAKEEIKAYKQKESLLSDILMRLGVLESEKERVMEEKMTMSTDVTRYQQNLDASNLEIQQLKAKLQDKTTECEQLERKFHIKSEELRNCQKSRDELDLEFRQVRRNNIALSEQIAEYKIEVKSVKDFLETTQSKLDNQISIAEKLDIELREGNEERRKLLNVVQELKGNIRVFCRVRPLLKKEILDGNDNTHIETSQKSIEITNDCNKNVPYTFDRVFGDTSSQEEIFTDVALLVQSALDGYNVCIFAYGQTGAGKTYTMEGQGDGVEMGIIPRAMKLIFQKSEELLKFGWKYKLSVQHVEIYCEVLQDLLNRETGVKLDIRTAGGVKNSSVWVHGLTEHEVTNQNMVKSLLKQANQKRATAATNANERSSRSHSVFMLKISACNELTGEQHTSVLNLIDLAGSERVANSGSSGVRLKEAQKINGSLSELSNVISALANKDSHVPYRNSKLTFLLMDSLSGNSKTLMVVNVNPMKKAVNETINTLRFATTVNKCNIGTAQKFIKFN